MITEIELAEKHSFRKGHVVLLTHDEMFKTKSEGAELKELIVHLKKMGYILRTLEQYGQP